MKFFSINKYRFKFTAFLLIICLAATSLSGCNGDEQNNDTPTAQDSPQDETPNNEPSDTPENSQPEAAPDNTSAVPKAPEPNQTPIAEKSPMAISRIPAANPVYPSVSGITDDPLSEEPEEESDPHDHEPIPNLFPIDRCLVEVQGEYDSEFARNMVAAINAARVDYMIPEVTRNTSLLACADIRCKEQSYFIGHFRPDGRSWRSVAPGYVQGECIAVDYRTAEDVVNAWLNVNVTRVNLMNPDYTQVGTSVYNIDGTLFVAVEFGY